MRMNPVLDRELRQRVRGARSAVLLTIYLVLLGAFFMLAFAGYTSSARSNGSLLATDVAKVGRSTFEWLIFFMLMLVLFLVPGLTAGTVAGERERQTLVPMQVTLLRPRNIVAGKIQASMAFVSLLIVATLPLVSISFAVGGLSLFDALAGLGAVAFSGFVIACVATGCSSFARRTQTATLLAYTFTLFLTVGTFIVYGIAGAVTSNSSPPIAALTLNPLMNASTLAGGKATSFLDVDSPLKGLRSIVSRPSPASYSSQSSGSPSVASNDVRNFALGSTLLLMAMALLATWFASSKLKTPAVKER